MMRLLISLILLLPFLTTLGADPKYPVSEIPEEAKKGMYAVIREKEVLFEINSISSSRYYSRVAITILNANGKSLAEEAIGYDKMSSIKFFRCTAYDAFGNVIIKLKPSAIQDVSAYDGFSLYSDSRLKVADLTQNTYPYTVEFEYELELKFLYSLPDYYVYNDDEVYIQQSTYKIIYPGGLKPRYKLFKVPEPQVQTLDKKQALVWNFENVRPEKFERLGPDFPKVSPNIMVSPVDFEYGGYAGKMDTWENFGRWQAELNKGRGVLSETTKQRVRDITKGAKSLPEKTQLLYEYLQNKTRYVSIQLGIGGLQPFEAKVVDETGYGDCKALSNYMVSLLREVDVKAYYTTIMAGDDAYEVDPSFPSDQSNHIIVAVPNGADTIWLECTSQTNPFGYLGTFTGDRYGLMITETGGKLVKTPAYNATDNLQIRSAEVAVKASGDAQAKIRTSYSGIQYENGRLDFVLHQSYDDQKKWVQKNTRISSFDVNSFSMKDRGGKIPSATVNLDLTLNRLASVSGKRIFLTPNLMNRSSFVPEKLESRKTNIVLRTPSIDIDSIHFVLPEGVYPEVLPEAAKIKSRFGEYESSYKMDDKGLLYIRKMRLEKGEFPPSTYQELIDFFKGVSRADNSKLVLLNKT